MWLGIFFECRYSHSVSLWAQFCPHAHVNCSQRRWWVVYVWLRRQNLVQSCANAEWQQLVNGLSCFLLYYLNHCELAMLLAIFPSPPSPSVHSRWVLMQALHNLLELWGNSERETAMLIQDTASEAGNIPNWWKIYVCACLCVYVYSLTGWYLIFFFNSIWTMNTKHLLFLLLQRQYLQLKLLWWQSLSSICFRILLCFWLRPFKSLW